MELVYTPHHMSGGLFEIRDRNDYPVLYTAIIENADIFILNSYHHVHYRRWRHKNRSYI
jgi:hypothetical protein